MNDLPEARALWKGCFHDSPSFLDWFFTERYRPETSLCLEREGRIVSLAHGCPMRLRLRDATVTGLMVSGVSTREEYQGRGYMHRVMKGLFYLARENGISLLFNTPAALHTYDSLGFWPCTDALYWTAPENAPATEPAWDPFPSVTALTDCYAAAAARYSGIVLRGETETAQRLHDYQADGGRCLALWEKGILAGYLVAQPGEEPGSWTVPEAVAVGADGYAALLSRLPGGSAAKLPPDLSLPGERRPQGVMAPADVPGLLGAVCGDDRLIFHISDPMLPENNGVFDGMGRPAAGKADYTLSAPALTRLLLGYGPGDRRFPGLNCYCIDEY